MARDRATYLPIDVLKPVTNDVWIVDSGPIQAMGIPLPVRMTVIRLPEGGLVLHSPTRFTPNIKEELDGIGRVEHLVAPNSAHWTFLQEWQGCYRDATTWAAPGLRHRRQIRRAQLRIDGELNEETPPETWSGVIEVVLLTGSGGFAEAALFHEPSRTLILTDLIQNLEAGKLPPLVRPAAHLAGVTAPQGKAPIYLRAIVRLKGKEVKEKARRLVDLRPERVIFAHGRWFESNGTKRLRASLGWLLR